MSENRLKKIIILSLAGIVLVIGAYNLWAYQGTLLSPFLKDTMTGEPHIPIAKIVAEKGLTPGQGAEIRIEVVKSEHLLVLYSGDDVLKNYQVSLGKNPLADKEKAGDGKTPIGEFKITEMVRYSPPKRFYGSRLMMLNYPNRKYALKGLHQGLITSKDFLAIENAENKGVTPPQDTEMGGGIAIHGGWGPFMGSSWTGGSIGLYSKDAEEIFEYVNEGTKVIIKR